MKITPTKDIAVKGAHCPRGIPVEVDDVTARILIGDGAAYITQSAPVIETAEAKPTVEVAVIKHSKRTR
jgi:hypothetical protein